MGFEDILNAIAQLRSMVAEQGIVSGQIPHVLSQLEGFIQARLQAQEAQLEQKVTLTITSTKGLIIGFMEEQTQQLKRAIDLANLSIAQDTENKTTTALRTLLADQKAQQQVFFDVIKNAVGGRISTFDVENIELTPDNRAKLEQQLQVLFRRMIDEKFSPLLLTEGFERLRFQDSAGKVFEPAIKWLFGPDGPIASVALQEASGSPNFHPAMEVIFGPGGKLADAAQDTSSAANLEPALDNLENKIEEGVTEAMDQAGEAVAAHGAASLGSQISAGATALGNVLTAVPQLYDSVTKLGEAWDKPLGSTEDYMNLFAAAGSTITQGVQTFEALASVTKIASAAQAVFNAVMAMNPIVLIVIAVIALIAAIVALIVYWDQVEAAVRDNPWIAAIGLILGPIGILIGLIILIIAYWDEVKLAVLQAANFISIQIQKIGAFLVGLWTLAGQVWDAIVASVINMGIGIVNTFITIGTEIQNFFIGLVNSILEMYNEVATSAIGEFVGLEPAELIPEVELETRLIPPREVPEIDVAAAFDTGPITGGLEGMIAEQEAAVASARAEDEARRAREAAPPPAAAAPGAGPGLPAGLPAGPPPALPPLPAEAALPRPVLPEAAGPAAAAGPIDASVNVQGGITVNINAERLEVDAAQLLSDEIIAQLQARLGALRSEQDFRTGVRAPAPA
jgi:hypothetical protein